MTSPSKLKRVITEYTYNKSDGNINGTVRQCKIPVGARFIGVQSDNHNLYVYYEDGKVFEDAALDICRLHVLFEGKDMPKHSCKLVYQHFKPSIFASSEIIFVFLEDPEKWGVDL